MPPLAHVRHLSARELDAPVRGEIGEIAPEPKALAAQRTDLVRAFTSRSPLARPAVEQREDGYVLEGRAADAQCRFDWACTGGELASAGPSCVAWRPPVEKGLYQVQLIGETDEGLAFDTLEIEIA